MDSLTLFYAATPLFSALGDVQRQQIIILLSGRKQLNVSELTELLPISRPAISHHLKLLRDAGLVAVERRGKERFYSLRLRSAAEQLRQLADSIECDDIPLKTEETI